MPSLQKKGERYETFKYFNDGNVNGFWYIYNAWHACTRTRESRTWTDLTPINAGSKDTQKIKIILPTPGEKYSVYYDTCAMGNSRDVYDDMSTELYCITWAQTPHKIDPDNNTNTYAVPHRTPYDKYYIASSDGKEITGTSHTGDAFVNKTTWTFSSDATTNTIS
jgi:hypothetical protein